MSNPSLTSFFARRNRDRSETLCESNQSLTSNVNAENASATRVPIESEVPKVESSPVVADTTNQTGSTISFSANAFDIAFDNQTVATATPPTFADVVKNEK